MDALPRAGAQLHGAQQRIFTPSSAFVTSVLSATSSESWSTSYPTSDPPLARISPSCIKPDQGGRQDTSSVPSRLGTLLWTASQNFIDSIWFGTIHKSWNVADTPENVDEQDDLFSIPQYVLDYAPYVHLFSGEEFWPCDIASHLRHTTPHSNYTPIEGMEHDRTVDNLDELNRFGWYTYLQSDDNVESRPKWLAGTRNIPSVPDSDNSAGNVSDSPGGQSSAPAILVVIPKEDGIIDAFWFYFYSYNLGNKVLDVRFGNHVGDWEHTMIRFQHGEPTHVFLSEHNFGEAYAFSALEKIGKRPLTFSATGSHAMYATAGPHPYVLPLGLLHDQTDRGPLWDPARNFYGYKYDLGSRRLAVSTQTPKAPTSWFFYRGHWGDRAYPMSDKRQYSFAGQYHYVSGPLGPIYKSLARQTVCQGRGRCKIKYWLPPVGQLKFWDGGDTDGDEEVDYEGHED